MCLLMMIPSLRTSFGLCALGVLAAASTLHASTAGSDNASDAAYAGGWANGSNGGTGFQPWSLIPNINVPAFVGPVTNAPATAGNFIGTSTELNGGNTGANIDSAGGRSFGIYGQNANNGDAGLGGFDAYRSFAGGGLVVGQSFSISIAVNFRNGNKGIDLFSGGNQFLNLNVGGDAYGVNPSAGSGIISTTLTNDYSANTAFSLTLTQTTAAGGTFTIQRTGGITQTVTGTYNGVPDQFHLYSNNTDQGTPNNLYANNLSITNVPEPGTWATLLLGGAGALGIYARRRKAVAC